MDGGGLGLMVSVSMPVYTSFQDSSGRSHTLLAAVVGTDVLMSTLEEHANSNLVVSELISQSARCTISSLSDCELQQLRLSVQSQSCEQAGTCAVCGADDLNVSALSSTVTGLIDATRRAVGKNILHFPPLETAGDRLRASN